MCGVTPDNIDYVAKVIREVVVRGEIDSPRLRVSNSGGYYEGSSSHCKGDRCIIHPRGEFSAVPLGFPFKLRRFVQFQRDYFVVRLEHSS